MISFEVVKLIIFYQTIKLNSEQSHTKLIKDKAKSLGFSGIGVSQASEIKKEAGHFDYWISKGYHGQMGYMERNLEKRKDPQLLFKGAQSIISVVLNYYPVKLQPQRADVPQIAKYAYGKDYHNVVKGKLFLLLEFIQQNIKNVKGKVCVDTAPFFDKAWAQHGGLGWIGKNTLLITPEHGSYVVIGALIIDINLEYDTPMKPQCGDCRRCIDACPAGAIVEPYILDARKCISYLTIEHRKEVTVDTDLYNRVFGCDICQDVCPYNKMPKPHNVDDFLPKDEILKYKRSDWLEMGEKDFKRIFKDSPVERTGYKFFRDNLKS